MGALPEIHQLQNHKDESHNEDELKACGSVSDCDTLSHTSTKRINYFELLDPENLAKRMVINHKG